MIAASSLLALIYAATCLALIGAMVLRRSLLSVHFGVIALFSLGYYPLPVLGKAWTSLAQTSDEKIFSALLIHYLFLCSALVAATLASPRVGAIRPLGFGVLDALVLRHSSLLALVAFGLYLGFVATTPRTSYASEAFDEFFEQKSNIRSILAAVSGFSSGLVSFLFALAARRGEKRAQIVCGAMILTIVALALPLGQRLAAIAPIMMLFAAMATLGQTGKAFRLLIGAVIFLLAVSPFAVHLRQTRRDVSGNFLSASQAAQNYRLDDNPLAQSLQSILDRSDLVFNTVVMKDEIERTGFVGWRYYYSVVVAPVPRFLYPEKPYVLSDNGAIDGEISVRAWRLAYGTLGSLTAFGGLTAYSEGGWIGVVLDGLALGALFAVLARWLGQGGLLARVFYVNFFVILAVQKVPPAFFEALASILGLAPPILLLFIVSRLRIFVRRAPPTSCWPLAPIGEIRP